MFAEYIGKNTPMGCIYALTIWVNPETSTGCALLVLGQVKFQHDNLIEIEKLIERYCIEEVGVDPEPLCSCPWTRCSTYHEAYCNDNYPRGINSSCIYDWVPCDHGPNRDILL